MMAEEIVQLSKENKRLHVENVQLKEENQNLSFTCQAMARKLDDLEKIRQQYEEQMADEKHSHEKSLSGLCDELLVKNEEIEIYQAQLRHYTDDFTEEQRVRKSAEQRVKKLEEELTLMKELIPKDHVASVSKHREEAEGRIQQNYYGMGSSSPHEVLLGDLAVEVTFPGCSFFRLTDALVSSNEDTMRALAEGEVLLYAGRGRWELTAGSRAEGLMLEQYWGHGEADWDVMWLHGQDLAVGVGNSAQLPPEDTTLVSRDEGCPAAYVRLEVIHEDRLLEAIRSKIINRAVSASDCVCGDGEDSHLWLRSRPLVEAMKLPRCDSVKGPASSGAGCLEYILGLVCSGPHSDMDAFSQGHRRGWPSHEQIHNLLSLPMLLVCVGPKGHLDAGHLFRMSWSPHEMRLLSDLMLSMKQGYICFKHVMKVRAASCPRGCASSAA